MTPNATQQQPVSQTIDQLMQQAIARHQSGHLLEAGELYQAILHSEPNHPEANHNLGVIAVQAQQPAAGLPYFVTALDADPTRGKYWLNYIDALSQAGQQEDAHAVLTLARQQGLQGDDVDVLAASLTAASGQANVEDRQPSGGSSPLAVPSSKQRNKSANTRPAKQGRLAGKHMPHKGKAPSPQEVNSLVALFSSGRLSEAVTLARKMTERFPLNGFGWMILGLAFRQMGRSADALTPLQKSVERSPGEVDAHNNLGITLKDLGRLDEAEASYRRALQINPDYAEAHYNLGNLLKDLERLDESEASYRQALALKPDWAVAYNNLGAILQDLNRLDESAENLRLALRIKPDYAEAHYNLGKTLLNLRKLDQAVASFCRARELNPKHAETHAKLGDTFKELSWLDEAEASYRKALEINPDSILTQCALGNVLYELNRLDEAMSIYRQVLDSQPDIAVIRSNLLFFHNLLANRPPSHYLAEARQYGQITADKVTTRFTEWSCAMQPERLRIGFVSADLKNHPVGYFLESLLNHLDPNTVELIAYPASRKSDGLTARIKPRFSAWKPIVDLTDEDAARLIHSDGIHVLIDLSGHTLGNRLPVFSWKPAPVQVSWLGYFATTGVREIDYLLGDRHVSPADEENHFTEKIWQLPDSYLCFTEPDIDLDVAPLPALSTGSITFGCFNNLTKMNDAVVAVWASILAAVPESRLFLKTMLMKDSSTRKVTLERFSRHGIPAERLILESASPRAELLAAYHRVDIALDPFPYPGGTTSVESLWMGVPVITKRGDRFLSHVGETIAHNAGLPDWVAVDDDDYIAKAVAHAADLNQLGTLRAGLRQQVLASPLLDAPRFARHFEEAILEIWKQWLKRK